MLHCKPLYSPKPPPKLLCATNGLGLQAGMQVNKQHTQNFDPARSIHTNRPALQVLPSVRHFSSNITLHTWPAAWSGCQGIPALHQLLRMLRLKADYHMLG
eukprot:GHRR01032773.1.p1 GENE.GHRR01032773.1~~GHRR01032773.1.p1  ORF type:complete len:101 (-),score=11.73 GHRR01032773.1:392-694(-)